MGVHRLHSLGYVVGCIEGRVSVHFSQETPVRFDDWFKRRPANPTASNAIGRMRTAHRSSIQSMRWKSTHRRVFFQEKTM